MSEPNKKMEELLKRYAGERKAESSTPFEVHPATRQMLQGEVARTFPKASVENRFVRLLWPRLAIAGAFTAMLVFTVIMLNKPTRQMELAQSSAKPMAPAPVQSQLSEEANPVLDDSANETPPPKREIAAAPSASTPNLYAERKDSSRTRALDNAARFEQKLSEPIQQPVPAEQNREALADKKVPAKSETALAFARTTSVGGAAVPVLPQSPAAASPKAFFADAESQNRWEFVQQDLRAKYRRNLLSPAQPKILQSFELVRTGNKIRLNENDGSIYEGEILAATQAKPGEKDSAAARDENSGFAFSAVGTNQQLNRVVTFTGNFAFTNRAAENAPIGHSGALAKQKPAALIGIVQGKVSIAGTNEFQIRAVESGE